MTNEPKEACAAAPAEVLADTHFLYLKMHNLHWNVQDERFHALHVMFEGQCGDMWAAFDEIAERSRALGEDAPGTCAKLAALATNRENGAIRTAQESGDEPSAGMLTDRQITHEKQIWVMRSMLA